MKYRNSDRSEFYWYLFKFFFAIVIIWTISSLLAQEVSEIVEGSKVTFYATADGTPAPTFEWKHNGYVVASGPSFVIESIGFEDSGDYKATARNVAGSADSQTITLVVVASGPKRPAVPTNIKVELKRKEQ
jgi:hypothetical protein